MNYQELFDALILVESGKFPGEPIPNRILGDNGEAFGPLQIHKGVVSDVNRVYGTSFRHEDAFYADKAKEICGLYLAYWCSEKRLGRPPTMEDCARCWNSGPTFFKKPEKTNNYWNRVQLALSKIQTNKQ